MGMLEANSDRNSFPGNSSAPQRDSALSPVHSFVRMLEKTPSTTWMLAALILIAGAGRGVTSGFEGGSVPMLGHALAALLIWLIYAGLVWNVAHRIFGYAEGFLELARVVAISAVPLVALWLNAIPSIGGMLWFSIGLHALAFATLVVATRLALSISHLRAIGICVLALGIAILLLTILGLFLVGSPAWGGGGVRNSSQTPSSGSHIESSQGLDGSLRRTWR
jgi:hypothetical protein